MLMIQFMENIGDLKLSSKRIGTLLKRGAELKITRPQAEALKHLYNWHDIKNRLGLTYLEFRRSLRAVIGCDDLVIIDCGGICVAITLEGHRHS